MKLIDILVEELPKRGGWPEGAAKSASYSHLPGVHFWDGDGFRVDCSDLTTRALGCEKVTLEQYEAALAAKNDGWIDWGGGECPVPGGALIDVRYHDGRVFEAGRAEYFEWGHGFSFVAAGAEITAYRLHKPQEVTEGDEEADLNECIGQDVAPVWGGDGLPPDGCECEYQYKVHGSEWHPLECVAVDGKAVFGWSNNTPVALQSNTHNFRPLRSEADKKRDDMANAIDGFISGFKNEKIGSNKKLAYALTDYLALLEKL